MNYTNTINQMQMSITKRFRQNIPSEIHWTCINRNIIDRLIGAKEVKGKTITFLDAHCECTEGWLEPLLNEIALNRKAVVCPIIDVISDDTFEYVTASDMTWGGFNWKLNFRWYVFLDIDIYYYFDLKIFRIWSLPWSW